MASIRGAYIWFGAVMFTIQLYADFSGCMDIVIGAAEALGIRLPEKGAALFLKDDFRVLEALAHHARRVDAELCFLSAAPDKGRNDAVVPDAPEEIGKEGGQGDPRPFSRCSSCGRRSACGMAEISNMSWGPACCTGFISWPAS